MNTEVQPNIEEVIGAIVAPSEAYLAQAKTRLDALTKPLGSLGRLEDLAAQWFAIRQGNLAGPVSKAVYVFAADHGITAEGVSAYPAKVTQQMVLNFLSGGAAINVLARHNNVEVKVVDVGVDADLFGYAGLTDGKVRRGSRNMLREPAMTPEGKQPDRDRGNGHWQHHRCQRHDCGAYRHAGQPRHRQRDGPR
jgi:nicotinate-nucleotide--dimethylbenzimidazole phosphoribosyltransferase